MRRIFGRDGVIPRSLTIKILPGLGLSILAGGVLYIIGSLRHGIAGSVLVVALGWVVATLALWAVQSTGAQAERAYWVSDPRQEAVPPAALDYRLVRLRRDLRDALERDDRPDEIYPVLHDLAAERLRAHHGIDLDAQPEAARDVMTPALWRYLDRPPTDTRKRSASSLHTAIEGIEDL